MLEFLGNVVKNAVHYQGSGVTTSSDTPTTPKSIAEANVNPRKRKLDQRQVDIVTKKPATEQESMIRLIKAPTNGAPALVTLTPTDSAIGVKVMTSGGASAKGVALMNEVESIFKSAVFDAGFAYRHLKGVHKENVDNMLGWAGGLLVGIATALVPDAFIEKGFNDIVLPKLRTSEGPIDPKSMEGVAINGLQSLSAVDMRHFIDIAKRVTVDTAPTGFDSRLMKLKHLLTKMENNEVMSEDGINLQSKKLPKFEGQYGTYILKSIGVLPNGKKQLFKLACVCAATEAAVMVMIRIGKSPENPKGYLIPILMIVDTASIDKFITALEKHQVLCRDDITVYQANFTL